MSVSLPKGIPPSLETVCHLCHISSAMLFLSQSLKYFLPLSSIYLRLSSIPISFNFQTFPAPHPGPGPETSEAPALPFGSSKPSRGDNMGTNAQKPMIWSQAGSWAEPHGSPAVGGMVSE